MKKYILNVEYVHIFINAPFSFHWAFPVAQTVESACSAEGQGSVPESGRSPGEGNGNSLQYSCLENLMDGGAWRATVHEITKNTTE